MSPTADLGNPGKQPRVFTANRQAPSVQLQVTGSQLRLLQLVIHLTSCLSTQECYQFFFRWQIKMVQKVIFFIVTIM
uniref:Uncharacterized protein LOC103327256 n=1 Tax=Rhizophora mucronata TaxID=61149 RepID=A0A2P2JWJ7_RHIMU